jgi:hypothetical protein
MAKRKTPKVEALRPEKITEEQLNKIQSIVKNINVAQSDLGAIEVRKHEVLHGIMGLQGNLAEMRAEFMSDYGTDDINIVDGKIKYNDTVEANKKDNDR